MGNRVPAQILQFLTCLLSFVRPSIVVKGVGRSTSRLFFSNSVREFLKLIGVNADCDCVQQLVMQQPRESQRQWSTFQKPFSERAQKERMTLVNRMLSLKKWEIHRAALSCNRGIGGDWDCWMDASEYGAAPAPSLIWSLSLCKPSATCDTSVV